MGAARTAIGSLGGSHHKRKSNDKNDVVMTKQQRIAELRRQVDQAQTMMHVSMQNYTIAAQIESERKSELDALGASAPARKGYEMTTEDKVGLKAAMIRKPKVKPDEAI